MERATKAPPRHHYGRWIALPFLVLLGIVVIGVSILLINPSAVVTRVKDVALPKVSEQLGRPVHVGDIHVKLLPHLGVAISNVTIAGRPGEPSMVSSNETRVSLRAWPLIRSRGKDIQVSSVELRDVNVNLIHYPDGHWNYEDLGKGSAPATKEKPPEKPAEENAPASPPPQIAAGEISIVNGSVHVIDEAAPKQGAAAQATIALSQINLTAHHVGPGLPATLDLSAALASAEPNIHGSFSVNPVPASADFVKQGPWPKVEGQLSIDALQLQRFAELIPGELEKAIRGGRISVAVKVTTRPDSTYAASAHAKIDELALRGSPASGAFTAEATMRPPKLGTLTANVTSLELSGPGIDLHGTASYQAANERLRFAFQGQRLNTDELLGAMPPSQPSQPGAAPAKPAAKENASLLPPSMRRTAKKADVEGTLAIHEITAGKLHAQNLQAKVSLDKGVVTLAQGRLGLYGGQAVLDGTKVDLAKDKPEWDANARLENVHVDPALRDFTGSAPMNGTVSGSVVAHAAGNDWDQIRPTLDGKAHIKIDGELTTVNLVEEITKPLGGALQQIHIGGATAPSTGKMTTPLKDVNIDVTIKDGWATLTQPMTVSTSMGNIVVTGRVGLDQRLDLTGKADVTQSFLATVTGGALKLPGPVSVPLKIGGTLSAPAVTGVEWGSVLNQGILGGLKQTGQGVFQKLVPRL